MFYFILDGVTKEFPVTRIPLEKVVDTNGAGDAFVGGNGVNLRRLNFAFTFIAHVVVNPHLSHD